jgi:hypothetical protein
MLLSLVQKAYKLDPVVHASSALMQTALVKDGANTSKAVGLFESKQQNQLIMKGQLKY